MTFKKLVQMICTIRTENDRNNVFGQIDRSFNLGKIAFADHEMLHELASKINVDG